MTLVEFHSHTRTFALLLLLFRPAHGCVMDHEVEPLLRAPPPRARDGGCAASRSRRPSRASSSLSPHSCWCAPSARCSARASPILGAADSLGVTPRDARADPDVPPLPLSLFPRDRPIAAFDAAPSSPSASRRTRLVRGALQDGSLLRDVVQPPPVHGRDVVPEESGKPPARRRRRREHRPRWRRRRGHPRRRPGLRPGVRFWTHRSRGSRSPRV